MTPKEVAIRARQDVARMGRRLGVRLADRASTAEGDCRDMIRIVVTGGNMFGRVPDMSHSSPAYVTETHRANRERALMHRILRMLGPTRIAHTGRAGAEIGAGYWGSLRGVETVVYDEECFEKMLHAEKPDLVVCFPGEDERRDEVMRRLEVQVMPVLP